MKFEGKEIVPRWSSESISKLPRGEGTGDKDLPGSAQIHCSVDGSLLFAENNRPKAFAVDEFSGTIRLDIASCSNGTLTFT